MKTPEWQAARRRSIERKAWIAFALCLFIGLAAGSIWYLRMASAYSAYLLQTGDTVSGLIVDAPVEFHGVEVGRVAEISLNGPDSVNVVLNIRKGTPVSLSTVATITTRGLAARGFMGYVYVALENGGSRPGSLTLDTVSHLPLIAVGPARSISLDTAISEVGANVQAVNSLLQSALNQNALAELDTSLRNLERISEMLAANSERLNAILASTERASRQVTPLLEAGNQTLRAMQTQVLPEAYRTLAEMQALSRSMAGVADKLNRDPSVVVRGMPSTSPGPGERDGRR
jgi:phospholipid/cholesterol/gamma-HCH transport system substrate-binding protein